MVNTAARLLLWLGRLLDTVTERSGRWAWRGYWQLRGVRLMWRGYVILTTALIIATLVLALKELAR